MSRLASAVRALGPYAIALGAVAVATLGRVALQPVTGDQLPFAPFFLAVSAVAWLYGAGPAAAAILAGMLATVWMFLAPVGTLWIDSLVDAANLFVSLLISSLIALLAVRARGEKAAHEARRNALEAEIAERRQVEQALNEASEQLQALNHTLEDRVADRTAEVERLAGHLRALAAELADVEQQERRRLALVLHDHVQQILVGARMQAQAVRRRLGDDLSVTLCEELDASLREAIDASRSLAVELSPPVLRDAGLGAALEWLAARMRDRHGLAVTLTCGTGAEPSDQGRTLLFECTRELLLNVLKHAGVREARVTLDRTDAGVRLVVQDAGQGFDAAAAARREGEPTFGLFSIQQRLAYVGGECTIDSAPGRGTRVSMLLPMRDRRSSGTNPAPLDAPQPA